MWQLGSVCVWLCGVMLLECVTVSWCVVCCCVVLQYTIPCLCVELSGVLRCDVLHKRFVFQRMELQPHEREKVCTSSRRIPRPREHYYECRGCHVLEVEHVFFIRTSRGVSGTVCRLTDKCISVSVSVSLRTAVWFDEAEGLCRPVHVVVQRHVFSRGYVSARVFE